MFQSHHAATTRWRYFGGAGLLLASFFFMLACYFMNAGSSRAGLLGNPQQFQVVDEVTLLFEGKLYKAVSPHGTSKDRSLSEHGSESNSNVSQECEEQRLQFGTSAYWFNVGICLFLVCLAGVMSGLTVGFSSIDPLRLDILKESKLPADQENRKRAEMVEPVMRNHHRLLVTLLLTNAAAMEALPIFLDSLFPSYIAIILSVTFVLFFGEVIPQALCTKNPLQIGAIWAPFISCLMTLEIPLVYPIAAMLDLILGHDGKRYLFRRSELATLISFHSKRRDKGGDLQEVDEVRIIQGALQLRNITVKEAMTPESEIFMLDYNTVLNSDIMADIMAHGHSRIPVYKDRRANIVGMLLIKRLILLNPEDEVPVKKVLYRKPLAVTEEMDLVEALNFFQKRHCHLAIVLKDERDRVEVERCMAAMNLDVPEHIDVKGVITIEDVIEDLIQEEIYDETDAAREEKLAQITFSQWQKFLTKKKAQREGKDVQIDDRTRAMSDDLRQRGLEKAKRTLSNAAKRARRRNFTKSVRKALATDSLLKHSDGKDYKCSGK